MFGVDALEKMMRDIVKQDRVSERKLIVHTGLRGMHFFNLQLMRSNLRGNVTELRRENKLSAEEADTLYSMIDSPDEENLVVAKSIIETKI